MPVVHFPYGRTQITYDFPGENFLGCLSPALKRYECAGTPEEIIKNAIENPIGTEPLAVLARGKKKVTVLLSDHTRPVPSRLILPALLSEIRKGNPDAEITLLVATGCHRATTGRELEEKLGAEIMRQERVAVHDCDAVMEYCGTLPSGGALWLNPIAVHADLLVAEGFIEPHFFAGFSGGRKSVLPGIAGRSSVLYNHNAAFIAHPRARAGVLTGNPLHRDMCCAARLAKLAFICNVVLNQDKNIIHAVAGDCVEAHEAGCRFLQTWCSVPRVQADIVVTSNGGYPLDQNIYQAVKGLSTAQELVKPGGVIVMLAQSEDGHGGENFLRHFTENKELTHLETVILGTAPEHTEPDQWQSQILLRVLRRATVIYVSSLMPETVSAFHMVPARTLPQAMGLARKYVQTSAPEVVAVPDGVGAIVMEQEERFI